MIHSIRRCGLGAVASAVFTGPVLAHHGDAGRFSEETVTLTGTVVAVQLVNPHTTILFEVVDEQGKRSTWQAELGSPRQLSMSFGWDRQTLLPGTRILVTGRAVKSGAPYINLTERSRIVLAGSCEEIFHSATLPETSVSCTPQT
jgi:hypothetical protein